MAAATVPGLTDTFLSNKRVAIATLALAATGDTWDTGMKRLDSVLWSSKTANVPGSYYTISGGVITFTYTGGGAASLSVMAIGG